MIVGPIANTRTCEGCGKGLMVRTGSAARYHPECRSRRFSELGRASMRALANPPADLPIAPVPPLSLPPGPRPVRLGTPRVKEPRRPASKAMAAQVAEVPTPAAAPPQAAPAKPWRVLPSGMVVRWGED